MRFRPTYESVSYVSAFRGEAEPSRSDLGAVEGALPIPEGNVLLCNMYMWGVDAKYMTV